MAVAMGKEFTEHLLKSGDEGSPVTWSLLPKKKKKKEHVVLEDKNANVSYTTLLTPVILNHQLI